MDRAIAGLREDGKIICVRLALFADMVKGRPWLPDTLIEVGGAEGVGVAFLQEAFSAVCAHPTHRVHRRAAQDVLRALLPPLNSEDIKGAMRSQRYLMDASSYAERPRDFDALMEILDGELRLITPTDCTEYDFEEHSDVIRDHEDRYYQLTHDYIVPSVRCWLTVSQSVVERTLAWCQRECHISEAGSAAIALGSILLIWHLFGIIYVAAGGLDDDLPSLQPQLAIGWLGFYAMMGIVSLVIGWQTIMRRKSAICLGLFMSAVFAVFTLGVAFSWIDHELGGIMTNHVQRNIVFSAAFFVLLLVCLLFCIAMYAFRHIATHEKRMSARH